MANLHILLLLLQIALLLGISCQSHQQQLPIEKDNANVDLAALAAIKDSLTDIPGTHFLSTWNFTSPDPCSTFAGITCSLNRVTTLTLGTGLSGSPGLAGSLSPALSNLSSLTQLVLHPGLVTGPIPPQLARLTSLRVLSLTNNRLTGPIPTSLSSLPNLHTLDLSNNWLTETVPAGLLSAARSPQLRVLILGSNKLSGELPRSVSAELIHLDLENNMLTGKLPLRLPSSIRYLSVSNNMMGGPLNNGLLSLSSSELAYLDLSSNQFSGSIPHSLFQHPKLASLFLQRNNLSGGVTSSTCGIASLSGSIIDLSHNMLTGEPSPALAGAETLFLNNNRLSGRVPMEYARSVYQGTTKTLYLQHNYLSTFPFLRGLALPDSVSLCLSYNCMISPVKGLTACPGSAGGLLSRRPESQCAAFYNGSSTH